MSQSPAPATPSARREPRNLVLTAVTAVVALVGGVFTAVAVGALLSFLPPLAGVAVGLIVGIGFPVFLALRAAAALKRRRLVAVIRRVIVLFLIEATQLAITGAILQYSPRGTADLAYTSWAVLDIVGGVPWLSDHLYNYAKDNHAVPVEVLKAKKAGIKRVVGPDGGVVLVGPDGGVILDAGPVDFDDDGGPPGAGGPDGGPAAADGGPALAADAGPAPLDGGVADAFTAPVPPTPKPEAGLSPRTEGRAARTFAAGLHTNTGDSLILVGTVAAGGAFSSRVIDLAATAKLGDPTIIECADDGTVAAVLGGGHLVTAKGGRTTAQVVKQLEPGQKLGDLEIEGVKDVVVGPGGSGLAIVSVLAGQNGEVAQDLVALPKGAGAPLVLRKSGDKVPGSATDATVVKGFSFKKSSGGPSVLVAETYLDGGDDVGTRMSGDTWLLNPQRLLAVKLDAPKGLVELARSGTETSGIDGRELQIFGDAWLMPDGRALFDANFIEKGPEGWLFLTKAGGLFALAPDRFGKGAPWSLAPPRARYLEAASDGTFIFRRDDGAVVRSSVDRPAEATAALLGADALGHDGKKIGVVKSVDVPILASGGEWIVATAQIQAATAHDALLLASRADAQNGNAEVLLEVGAPVPEGRHGKHPARTIQSIRFDKGRDELLWQR